MIKEFLHKIFKPNVEIQTVPIEEYNKTKQALEEANTKIISLEQTNETIINQNDITLAETERLESEMRIEQIKSILYSTTLTNEEIEKQLQVLPRSGLSIEFIQETYLPITKKNNIKGEFSTKLPQKSVPDRNKEFSYYK